VVDLSLDHHRAAVVARELRHEVPPVRGHVDEDVLGQGVDRPIQRALQHLVARVAGLEGEVVGEDDELERLRLHLVHDGRQAHEVVLVHLDDPEPLVRVGVEQRPDQ
jgi:hypothetical protein